MVEYLNGGGGGYTSLSWGAFRMADSALWEKEKATTVPESVAQAVRYYTAEPTPVTTSKTETPTTSISWGAFRQAETQLMPEGWSRASMEEFDRAMRWWEEEKKKTTTTTISTTTSTPKTPTSTTSTSTSLVNIPESVLEVARYYASQSTQQTPATSLPLNESGKTKTQIMLEGWGYTGIETPTSLSWGAFRQVETQLMPEGWSRASMEEFDRAMQWWEEEKKKTSATTTSTPTTTTAPKTPTATPTTTQAGKKVERIGNSGLPIYEDDSILVRYWKDLDKNNPMFQILDNLFGLSEWDRMTDEERQRYYEELNRVVRERPEEIYAALDRAGLSDDQKKAALDALVKLTSIASDVPPESKEKPFWEKYGLWIVIGFMFFILIIVLIRR